MSARAGLAAHAKQPAQVGAELDRCRLSSLSQCGSTSPYGESLRSTVSRDVTFAHHLTVSVISHKGSKKKWTSAAVLASGLAAIDQIKAVRVEIEYAQREGLHQASRFRVRRYPHRLCRGGA
jgi:hypothetical protein